MAEELGAGLRDEHGAAALKRRKVLEEGRPDRELEANVDELCRATKEWASKLGNANERLKDQLANTEVELVRTQRCLENKEEELMRIHMDLLKETLKTTDLQIENLQLRNILAGKNDRSKSTAVGFPDTTPGTILQNVLIENNGAAAAAAAARAGGGVGLASYYQCGVDSSSCAQMHARATSGVDAQLAAIKEITLDQSGASGGEDKCELCNIGMHRNDLETHLMGKKHRRALERKGQEQRSTVA